MASFGLFIVGLVRGRLSMVVEDDERVGLAGALKAH